MFIEKNIIQQDSDRSFGSSPARDLFCAIMNSALIDARSASAEFSIIAREAMDFLLTSRSDPYIELLELDPEAFRQGLIRTQHLECTRPPTYESESPVARMKAIATENKRRRIFRHNYKMYKSQVFSTPIPFNMIYETSPLATR